LLSTPLDKTAYASTAQIEQHPRHLAKTRHYEPRACKTSNDNRVDAVFNPLQLWLLFSPIASTASIPVLTHMPPLSFFFGLVGMGFLKAAHTLLEQLYGSEPEKVHAYLFGRLLTCPHE